MASGWGQVGMKLRAVGQALQGEEMTQRRSTEVGQSGHVLGHGAEAGQQGGHRLGARSPWGATVRAGPRALWGLSS